MVTTITPNGLPQPPGTAQNYVSYSDKMKLNLKRSERLKRKVLVITVESQGNFKIEDEDVAKLITRLGIDQKSHMEGFQICPGNSKKILLWLKDSCDIGTSVRRSSGRRSGGRLLAMT